MHLERQHRAGGDTEGRAFGEGEDVCAGRGSPYEGAHTALLFLFLVRGRRRLGNPMILPTKYHRPALGVACGGGRRRRAFRLAGEDQHVVYHFPRPRQDLDGLDPLVFGEVRGYIEILILYHALGRHFVLGRHRHDYVWRADGPAIRIHRHRRHVVRIAAGRAGIRPLGNRPLVGDREPPVVEERSVWGVGMPRRHEAGADGVENVGSLRAYLLVGQERHGAEPTGSVAARAVSVQNWRDVFCERRCGTLRPEPLA